MSESLFLQRQSSRFLAAHPREAGWVVHEFGGDSAEELSLNYLLDCLREWHPTAITRRTALPLVGVGAFRNLISACAASEASISNSASEEANAYGWRGTIELIWNGHDIHCHMFSLMLGKGCFGIYFVATKSLAAFRDLLLVLERYGKARLKEKKKEIYVVNGENIPVTASSWDDLVLPAQMARDIRSNVEGFFASPERYAALGIPHRRGFLFAGPPGCGKTLTLKTLASNTPAKFISVLGTADVDDSMLRHALDLAEGCTPAVVLFEDLDRMVQAKGVSISHFLNLLDGLKVLNGVLVIATCNEPEKLDPALLHRPSRFDRVWTFPLPALEQRLALLRKHGGLYFSDGALTEVARRTQGMSMTYVQEIVVNALLECAHEDKAPGDSDLLRSLKTIRAQRKDASKGVESLEEQDSVGFCMSN
ncbi:MAG: ATP-binding protein [Nitrospira sp.]|nr:MAG: ATP-binding protein [Nitrospira sp.]